MTIKFGEALRRTFAELGSSKVEFIYISTAWGVDCSVGAVICVGCGGERDDVRKHFRVLCSCEEERDMRECLLTALGYLFSVVSRWRCAGNITFGEALRRVFAKAGDRECGDVDVSCVRLDSTMLRVYVSILSSDLCEEFNGSFEIACGGKDDANEKGAFILALSTMLCAVCRWECKEANDE